MRAFIVHGYRAAPSSHWFGWLSTELRHRGIEPCVIALPRSMNPDPLRWQATIAQAVRQSNDSTLFITHSLGGIATLNYLSSVDEPVGGLICVAGFSTRVSSLPQLDPFTAREPRIEECARRIRHRAVVCSNNDPVVDPALSHQLAGRLNAPVIEVAGAGHFCEQEGVTRLPEICECIDAWQVTP